MRRVLLPPVGHGCASSNPWGVLAEIHPTDPTKLQPSSAQDESLSWISVPRRTHLLSCQPPASLFLQSQSVLGPGVPWKQGMSMGLRKMLGLSIWCMGLSRSFDTL